MSEKQQQSLRCEAELVLVSYPRLCPVVRRRVRPAQSSCYSCGEDGVIFIFIVLLVVFHLVSVDGVSVVRP